MVVAAGAPDGQAEPGRTERRRAVDHGIYPEFLLVHAPFFVGQGLAVERGPDHRPGGCVREQVAGDLLNREAIEGDVAVDGVDHPVPVDVGVGPGSVFLVPVRVRVAGQVEPVAAPALPEVGRGEQPVHQSLVRVRPGVAREGVDFLDRRRKPEQVVVEPTDEGVPVRLGRRRDSLSLELHQDETIDVVAYPGRRARGGRVDLPHGLERPVPRPHDPLGNPAAQGLDCARLERLPRHGHAHGGIGRADAPKQLARIGVSGNDGGTALLRRGERGVAVGELQTSGRAARGVAAEAVLGQDRPHVPLEVDGRLRPTLPLATGDPRHGDQQDDGQASSGRTSSAHRFCSSQVSTGASQGDNTDLSTISSIVAERQFENAAVHRFRYTRTE